MGQPWKRKRWCDFSHGGTGDTERHGLMLELQPETKLRGWSSEFELPGIGLPMSPDSGARSSAGFSRDSFQ